MTAELTKWLAVYLTDKQLPSHLADGTIHRPSHPEHKLSDWSVASDVT